MAIPARFERAAFRLGGECSILLSYGTMPGKTRVYGLPRFVEVDSGSDLRKLSNAIWASWLRMGNAHFYNDRRS